MIAERAHRYTETHAPGSIVPLERMYVRGSHDGDLIGHLTATRDEPDGLYGDLVIADTAAARDVMALIDAHTIDAVSMEFAARHQRRSVERRPGLHRDPHRHDVARRRVKRSHPAHDSLHPDRPRRRPDMPAPATLHG